MPKHWSEKKLICQCGKSFASGNAEAIHRHNFPAMCIPIKPAKSIVTKGKPS